MSGWPGKVRIPMNLGSLTISSIRQFPRFEESKRFLHVEYHDHIVAAWELRGYLTNMNLVQRI